MCVKVCLYEYVCEYVFMCECVCIYPYVLMYVSTCVCVLPYKALQMFLHAYAFMNTLVMHDRYDLN